MPSHVLFICGQNKLRSPTAEHVFADWPGIETSSAGLNNDAENPVTPELLQWADMIFVMERTHKTKLSAKFKRDLIDDTSVIVLNIPDEYTYMDPTLIAVLKEKVAPHLPHGKKKSE